MTNPTVEALQQENAELRRKLRELHDRGWEPRIGPEFTHAEARSRLTNSISITEIGPHLREVALRCVHLARECAGTRTAQELEEISVALTDLVDTLEAALSLSVPDNSVSR